MKVNAWIISIVLAAFSALSTGAFASEARVQRNIDTLLRNPMSDAAKEAGAQIIQFAGESPNYHVDLEVGYMPWVKDKGLPKGSQMLLAAFIAGNLKEQMRKNSSRPEPYAGVLAAIDVYQKIRRSDSNFRISKVEKFIAMQQQGTLRAYVDSVKKG